MSLKKRLKGITPEEIADGIMIPAKRTAKQKSEADRLLAEHRAKRRAEMTVEEELHFQLLKLKFQLEDYINESPYNPEFTFGYFLEQYLRLSNRKKKDFANDIQIHETLLSSLLKNRREPNESIMIRLELHSNNAIPAIDWFRLIEKGKEHQISTNKALRDKESRYVTRSLQFA
jgi:hypothetical protein